MRRTDAKKGRDVEDTYRKADTVPLVPLANDERL